MSVFDQEPDGDPHGECAAEIHRLEARIAELERLAPMCAEHGTGGGTRSGCPYCALIQQSSVFSQISYLCGVPNEMQVSAYDVHCNEYAVLDAVKRKFAELEAENARLDKRSAGLEASLADSNEALQVMGLKLSHAEADRVRLDWIEDNSYSLPYKDHGAGPELDLSRPAIDVLMRDQSHLANTVGPPTPVMDAAPACEQSLNDNAQKEAS